MTSDGLSTRAMTVAYFRLEQKVFWRNKASMAFQFLLPIMFVVVFGALFQNNSPVGGIRYSTYFVAGMVGVSVLATGFSNQAITVSFQRDLKLLKRLRGTPLPRNALFIGKILSSAATAVLQISIILVLGRLIYNIGMPQNWLPFLIAVTFGVVMFSTLGMAYSAVAPNGDAAVPMVQLPFILMQFVSGLFLPFQTMPKWLQLVADLLPLRWFMDMVRAAYIGTNYMGAFHETSFRPSRVHGVVAITSQWPAYLVLGAWFVIAGVYVLDSFRWENRR